MKRSRSEKREYCMRIAIPIWESKISPVLDTASRLLIVERENRSTTSRFEIYLDEQDVLRRCLRIQAAGVDTLICGAISRPFYRRLIGSGINVISGISGRPEDVLDAYLRGKLFCSKFMMPGCKEQMHARFKKRKQGKTGKGLSGS